MEIIFWIVTI